MDGKQVPRLFRCLALVLAFLVILALGETTADSTPGFGAMNHDNHDPSRNLLNDQYMSVDFASVYRSTTTNYINSGIDLAGGNGKKITLAASGSPLSTTNVTFYQSSVPLPATGFLQTGTGMNAVINGTLTYVIGGTTYSFWCAMTRVQEQGGGGGSTAVDAAYYCYDNTVATNA